MNSCWPPAVFIRSFLMPSGVKRVNLLVSLRINLQDLHKIGRNMLRLGAGRVVRDEFNLDGRDGSAAL